MRAQKVFRRLHYWGAAIAGIPVVIILATGILLQLKKNLAWVQPVEMRGSPGTPGVDFAQLLALAQSVPEAQVRTWDDIPRIEGRPQKGLIKLVSSNNHEIQIDLATGTILHAAHRRSDIIESIHDGSFFHSQAKLWLFLPAGIILFGLWCTGLYLFLLPFMAKRKQRARLAATRLLVPFALLAPLAAPAAAQAQAPRQGAPYHSHARLSAALDSLARARPQLVQLTELTKSAGGRAVHLVRVGAGANVDARPAVLLVANAHGPHILGSEIALRTVRDLSAAYGRDTAVTSLLDRNTVFVIPRLNPDAAEAFFESPLLERTRNATRYDDDKDGVDDENGPADLNGDGVITMMRILDPAGTLIPDPADPALLRRADSRRGEVGRYRLLIEGRDTDGDGQVGEDPPGGVDINRNFSNDFEFFREGGDHPFSSAEARAVAELFQQKEGIAAVYVVGPHDNLMRPWEGRTVPGIGGNPQGTSAGGPLTAILPQDAPWFAEMGRRFRTATGFTRVPPSVDARGDVLSWMYYHMGRFAFGTRGWWIPDAPADTARGAARPETPDPLAEERNAYRWLRANAPDQIVAWTPIQHPDFPGKTVEVGGIKPYALLNPPTAMLDSVTAKHSAFVRALAGSLPRLAIREVRVEAAGARVFRVTAQIANTGYLPTNATIGSRVRWPRRVRVDFEVAQTQSIVSGRAVQLLDVIDGSGGSTELTWLVVGDAGSTVTLKAATPMAGSASETITLRAR